MAKVKYPLTASNTCCHGRVDFGFLMITFLFLDQDLKQSGINLFSDQSPPPITFPALATAIFFLLSCLKYELKKDSITI